MASIQRPTMKTIVLAAVLIVPGLAPAIGAPMTKIEREHLMVHMQMTESWLIDEVSNLSPAQLNFRIAAGRWTILEVFEHLLIAEPIYWKQLQADLKLPPRKLEKTPTDEDVLWYGIDRVHRDKTEPGKEPKGQLSDVSQGIAEFRRLHAIMLEYVRTTGDDLRGHAMPEWGTDAYQCLLGISTHDQRHILQIREVKADPGFPKK
jgi:DinB superfamily